MKFQKIIFYCFYKINPIEDSFRSGLPIGTPTTGMLLSNLFDIFYSK